MKQLVLTLVVMYVLISQVLPRLFAVFMANEHAVVYLEGCDLESDDGEPCVLRGTYKRRVSDLMPYVEQEDGSRVFFNEDYVALIAYPVNENN